jgi:adenosylcobinamide kinase / adenosylcobinamide-phosphate guanylyltransferase
VHFITGGAFNGKRAWVKQNFERGSWLSAYQGIPFPHEINSKEDLLFIEGVEVWLKEITEEYDLNQCLDIFVSSLENWLLWEEANPNRKLVVIGTDISKGIVPMESENRIWRDVTGWAYQQLTAKAEKVEIIWYGLNQTIKGDGLK